MCYVRHLAHENTKEAIILECVEEFHVPFCGIGIFHFAHALLPVLCNELCGANIFGD